MLLLSNYCGLIYSKADSMDMLCRLQEISDDHEPTKWRKELYIEADWLREPIQIRYEEFEHFHSEGKREVSELIAEPGIGNPTISSSVNSPKKTDYISLLSYLDDKVRISEADEGLDLTVRSDFAMFLELPWENIVKSACVFREVISQVDAIFSDGQNNLLIALSHAHEGVGRDIRLIMKQEVKDIYDSINILTENNQSSFRIESIFLSKHTTRGVIESIDWKSFNYIHFIMHGHSNGFICLEQPGERYNEVDSMSIEELLIKLEGGNFKLFFLSMCYSAGGLSNTDSSAFQIIRAGLARYVIGYRNGVGEHSARVFAKLFYDSLSSGKEIKEVYKDALTVYQQGGSSEYAPILYNFAT